MMIRRSNLAQCWLCGRTGFLGLASEYFATVPARTRTQAESASSGWANLKIYGRSRFRPVVAWRSASAAMSATCLRSAFAARSRKRIEYELSRTTMMSAFLLLDLEE